MGGPDPEQLEKFGEAVDEKAERARGGAPEDAPPERAERAGQAEQDALRERGRPQDVRSARAKNSGHGKKTADKWNQ